MPNRLLLVPLMTRSTYTTSKTCGMCQRMKGAKCKWHAGYEPNAKAAGHGRPFLSVEVGDVAA